MNYSLSRLATWVDQRSMRKIQSKTAEGVPEVVG
jgi:hypothetical protein